MSLVANVSPAYTACQIDPVNGIPGTAAVNRPGLPSIYVNTHPKDLISITSHKLCNCFSNKLHVNPIHAYSCQVQDSPFMAWLLLIRIRGRRHVFVAGRDSLRSQGVKINQRIHQDAAQFAYLCQSTIVAKCLIVSEGKLPSLSNSCVRQIY